PGAPLAKAGHAVLLSAYGLRQAITTNAKPAEAVRAGASYCRRSLCCLPSASHCRHPLPVTQRYQ
ncbi:MAG: hypothetical protein ACRC9V_03145, partial [Aeromonas sp.]